MREDMASEKMTSTFLVQVYICAKSYGKSTISPLEQGLWT
jgi:hypothetical protein